MVKDTVCLFCLERSKKVSDICVYMCVILGKSILSIVNHHSTSLPLFTPSSTLPSSLKELSSYFYRYPLAPSSSYVPLVLCSRVFNFDLDFFSFLGLWAPLCSFTWKTSLRLTSLRYCSSSWAMGSEGDVSGSERTELGYDSMKGR